jgi:hypothetical protein
MKSLEITVTLSVNIGHDEAMRGMRWLNKVHTGSERIPLGQIAPEALVGAAHEFHCCKLIERSALLFEDGRIALIKEDKNEELGV